MISIRCGHCGKNLKVRDELAGKRAKCPGCGKAVAVPDPAASLSPRPAAPGGEERTLLPKPGQPQDPADVGGVTDLGAGLHAPTQSFPRPDVSRTVILDEDARRRFESAWQAGKPEPIENFLAKQGVSHYLATLEELVHIDIEFQWKAWSEKDGKAGQPPVVETYLARFPKLNQPEIVQRLVEQEFRVRHRHGNEPAIDDYQARFPGVKLQHLEAGPDVSSFLAPAQQPDEIGRLGPYRVLKVLGSGGMGVVFKAEDPGLRRLVALKAMLPGMANAPSAKERFFREARSAAALKHPHIVTIHQVGEDRGAPFLAMEFLEGEPLDERLKRDKKLPIAEVLEIGRQVAEGLAAAHGKGLIHRDIKPANIWLESACGLARGAKPQAGSQAKILDFGLARAMADRTHLTQTGAIIGTPAYMAPEQAGGKPVDHRCDLFSLGCVLYRMCTGQMAFKGDDTISILSAIALHTPATPAELNADVPQELSDLIMALLAKDAEHRPFSAHEIAKALHELEADDSDRTVQKPGKATTGIRKAAAGKTAAALSSLGERGVRRKKWSLLAGAGGIVAVVALAIFFLASRERQRPEDGEKQTTPLPATFTNSLGMEFVLVPKGKSWLGGGGGKVGDKEVEIKEDFYVGKYEVTQKEWEKVTGSNPSIFKVGAGVTKEDHNRLPVDSVTWDDCQAFIARLNMQVKESGWAYRLPTEVEWEYACRGGLIKEKFESAFYFYFETPTNTLLPEQANFNRHLNRTCKVGSYKPNRLGLYDMHGNVWEWCDDEVKGDKGDSRRALRSGCWGYGADYCVAPGRITHLPSYQDGYLGLRLARVRVADTKSAAKPPDKQASAYDQLRRADIDPYELKIAAGGDPAKAAPELVAIFGDSRLMQPFSPSVVDSDPAVSPCGTRIASSSYRDKGVRLWDVGTGELIRLIGSATSFTAQAFGAERKSLFGVDKDGKICAWDTDTGAEVRAPFQHPGARGLMIGQQGKVAATFDGAGQVRVWKLPDGEKVLQIQADANWPVVLSPDGARLAAVKDKQVRIWKVSDGEEEPALAALKGHRLEAFGPAGKLITYDGKKVSVWDLQSSKLQYSLGEVMSLPRVAASPDGRSLLTSACPYHANDRLWNLASGALEARLPSRSSRVVFFPDSKRIASVGPGNRVHIHDLDGRELLPAKGQVSIDRMGVAGEEIITYSPVDGAFYNWNIVERRVRVVKNPHGSTLVVSGDGKKLAVVESNKVDVLDPASGAVLHPLQAPFGLNGAALALSSDGRFVAAIDVSVPNKVVLWDLTTGQQKVLPITGHRLGFGRDGKLVAAAQSSEGLFKIIVWDLATAKPDKELQVPWTWPNIMRVSPDGTMAAVSGDNRLGVGIFDLVAGKKLKELPFDALLAFSLDSRKLATATASLVRIWDIRSGKLERQIDTGLGQVAVGLDYAPDGRHLVVANGNGTVFVLRLEQAIK